MQLLATVVILAAALCSVHGQWTPTDPAWNEGLPLATLPPFPCQPYEVPPNDKPATNVNELRAHDIKVIMAMGDSMTAAFAATSGHILDPPLIPREDRYLSGLIGAGQMRYALASLLGAVNPKLVGGATGPTLPLDGLSVDGHHLPIFLKRNAQLNAAISGAVVQDLQDEIDYLVEELTTTFSDDVDMENDWKMLTILIGANNICRACRNETKDDPETYGALLDAALERLFEEVPKLRVNLLPMFNISQVYGWAHTNSYCEFQWKTVDRSACACMTPPDTTQQDLAAVNHAAVAYREQVHQVAQKWQDKQLPEFNVVVQNFTSGLHLINRQLTSEFDCFHPSAIAHAWLGASLWNSIWQPPEQKLNNITWEKPFTFICPDRHSIIQ